MMIVLDASAGMEIVLSRPQSGYFRKRIMEASKVVSSELYKAEIMNTLWKYVKAGHLAKEQALHLYNIALGLVDEFKVMEVFGTEVISEAIRLNHSCYDLLYLVLARRFGAKLMTTDKKLFKLAQQEGIDVV